MLRGVGYGGSEVSATGDVLSLKGLTDLGSVGFLDVGEVRSNVAIERPTTECLYLLLGEAFLGHCGCCAYSERMVGKVFGWGTR